MDFSVVELSADDKEFRDRLRAFLAAIVTDEVRRRDRETGENFDEGVHLALGAEGYLATDWNDESEGGFSALRRRIWDLEIGRAHTPWFHWGTTAMVAQTVQQFGPPSSPTRCCPVCCPATSGCASATPSLRAAPMWRRVRPARLATVRAGSSTAPRCSRPTRTTPNTSSCLPTPIRTRRNTRT